ncbi:Pyridine nucleotide-disulphide oxidoreductase [Micromonospora nigra]|uniref:Pyridine nucleotide-disulphide oxidoreductase n=1 Tax=Micromonospora nigra TaxID=145857 RepID=A0A1C6RCX3_9ACTN|nr:FAD-dependent oxidoreductase [Micromonospora nigra]SCL14999.1 Pyridine nucleotide-disulphide oxidoreductase [Micromonospora nigra]
MNVDQPHDLSAAEPGVVDTGDDAPAGMDPEVALAAVRAGVAIIGAGPVGLAAALAAADAGWPFTVYESGSGVGGNVRRWGHVRLFTPWSMNVSEPMARHLTAAGHPVPDDADTCPTGAELVTRLLEPLASLPALAGRIELGTTVLAVGREGLLKHEEIGTDQRAAHPFRILVRRADGTTDVVRAGLVIDCTGNYATPNSTGDGGVPAPGEEEAGDRIVRQLPDVAGDPDGWAGRSVLLVGAGKSAQTAARDLAALTAAAPDTRVHWAVRGTQPGWGAVDDDPLPERQALVESSNRLAEGAQPGFQVLTGVRVDAFRPVGDRLGVRLTGAADLELQVDRVLSLTGHVPDPTLHRQLQVHECYATAAPIALAAELLGEEAGDCLAQASHGVNVLRNPEPNYFILGAKSYGRNSQFLLRVGYEQVAEVAGAYPAPARLG